MSNELTTTINTIFPDDCREIEVGERLLHVEIDKSLFELVEEEVYRKNSNELIDSRIAMIRKNWNGRSYTTSTARHFPQSQRDQAINEFLAITQWALVEAAQQKLSK